MKSLMVLVSVVLPGTSIYWIASAWLPMVRAMNEETDYKGERIAKVLARAGVGSRRDVEAMIDAGRITRDGQIIITPATLIENTDGIAVDGTPIEAPTQRLLYRFHKPRGVITTHKDPQGRRTVFDMLPKSIGRVISIGRLDLTSEGLLLLTNDGSLAHQLEAPSFGLGRVYKVRAFGTIDEKALAALADGCTIEGVRYGPIHAKVERKTGQNSWLMIRLQEGKNREIRRVLAHLGLTVNRLIRTDFGPLKLGQLRRGTLEIVPPNQVDALLRGEDKKGKKSGPGKGWAKAKKKPNKPPAGRRNMHKKRGKPNAKARPAS